MRPWTRIARRLACRSRKDPARNPRIPRDEPAAGGAAMMGRINWSRVVLGGLVAGVVVNVLEGALGFLMHSQWEEAMKTMKPPSGAVMAAHLFWSFVIGIAAIWLYAAAR